MAFAVAVLVTAGCGGDDGLEVRRGPTRELRVDSTLLLPVPPRAVLEKLVGRPVVGDTVVLRADGPVAVWVGRDEGPRGSLLVRLPTPMPEVVAWKAGTPVTLGGTLRKGDDGEFYVEATTIRRT